MNTLGEMYQRRKSIAFWVKATNATLVEASIRFKASHALVWKSCVEFGVYPRKADSYVNKFKFNTYKILKALLDGEKPADLAKQYNVTPERIRAIKYAAAEAGFKFK